MTPANPTLSDDSSSGSHPFPVTIAIQDTYPDALSYCYGCGRLNEHGYHIKSYWNPETEESTAIFTPEDYHIAIPGFVYGGLLASLVDCHGTGTASAAMAHFHPLEQGQPAYRFVTGTLTVKYLRPTPLGVPLTLLGKVKEIKGKKVIVEITLSANGEVCVMGEVITLQAPESMFR